MKKFAAALIAIIAGLILGLASAQTMMQRAQDVRDGTLGKWQSVQVDADSSSGFYAASAFLSKGQLPPPQGVRYYKRLADDEGNSLRGSCVIAVEGRMPESRWWFLKIETSAGVAALDAGSAIREADGSLLVSISQAPSAGNWLRVPDDGTYQLSLVIFERAKNTAEKPTPLPTVKRLWC